MIDISTWRCGNPPSTGQKQRYPSRFEYNLQKHYDVENKHILHMFSGQCDWGVTTDARAETGADIVAPYDVLPDGLGPFDMVIADPPYNAGFAVEWAKELPKPKWIAREAMKVLKDGGLFLLLHIIVLPAYKELNMKRVALHPILCGPNNAIRVLNVMRKMDYEPKGER